MEDPTGFVIDDHLAYEPLAALGWDVDAVPWSRDGVAWTDYDVVVVRSPWDYQDHAPAFFAVLDRIAALGVRLENSPALMRWNGDKRYLRELEQRGLPIPPTRWRDRLGPGDLAGLCAELEAPEWVIKPVVSANADGAFRLDGPAAAARAEEVEAYYRDRALMAQPFIPSVVEEGEYSLFYFNGEHSHTICKTPKAGDFRVQEEHGGRIREVDTDARLARAGSAAMACLDEAPLYARADFVRGDDPDEFWLMEFELIEPALYLRMSEGAPERFAAAIDRRVRT